MRGKKEELPKFCIDCGTELVEYKQVYDGWDHLYLKCPNITPQEHTLYSVGKVPHVPKFDSQTGRKLV